MGKACSLTCTPLLSTKRGCPHKAEGSDHIPTGLLKEFATELSLVMTLIFQASLQQGEIPADWRQANITPVFKDKYYCPIEIIKGLTDKGQFQYLTKLMGPQEGTYLYATQFHSLR